MWGTVQLHSLRAHEAGPAGTSQKEEHSIMLSQEKKKNPWESAPSVPCVSVCVSSW